MICTICLQDIKNEKKINCCHKFCYGCIKKWYERSKHCPICRNVFDLSNSHNYNTRYNNYHKNREKILNEIKILMYGFDELDYDNKVIRLEEILKYIYDNKILLRNKKFKIAVIDKIKLLKKMNENIGFYWDQKIFCE